MPRPGTNGLAKGGERVVAGNPLNVRIQRLEELLSKLSEVPKDWLLGSTNGAAGSGHKEGEMHSSSCQSYATLIQSWRKALKWRQEMDDVLSVMLSVCLSTEQVGDQLFLKVIGDAGSGKTRFCDAILVSKTCYPLEHLTGFHSGWKDEEGGDYSLIARINKKTLVTPEGDVLMSGPRFTEIMSQQRRIFDGTSGASFKNRKEDMRYTGLRTPWIMAGTPALMDGDQSRLGDRFLRIVIDPPDENEKANILKRVGHTAIRAVRMTSDGKPESQMDDRLAEAYKLTGGYVDWLRSNAGDLLSSIEVDEDKVVAYCVMLGEFTASMRAAPGATDENVTKEVPTRLTHQFARMACCMTVVLNRKEIDSEVLRRVKKVAIDTSKGQTLEIAAELYKAGKEGMEVKTIHHNTNFSEDSTRRRLRFLKRIHVVEPFTVVVKGLSGGRVRWRLTEKYQQLYHEVMGE